MHVFVCVRVFVCAFTKRISTVCVDEDKNEVERNLTRMWEES